MLAAYAAPWPVAMTSVFALTGVVLIVIPVRRGEMWAVWMCISTFATPDVGQPYPPGSTL